MIQTNQPQFNSSAIEALKAATRQVAQPASSSDANFGLPAVTSSAIQTAPGEFNEPKHKLQSNQRRAHGNFAEEFVEKITSVEKETAEIAKEQLVVAQELSQVEQRQSDLIAKKKQLADRSMELITVKDKLTALDKELGEVLKFSSI